MRRNWQLLLATVLWAATVSPCLAQGQHAVALPPGVKAVWDLGKAYHETTPTRERICINGLWRWQPAETKGDRPPSGNWGYFKVPGCWPGITDNFLQYDCQTLYAHPSWKDTKLGSISTAWYQREITIPAAWAGRRIALSADYLNSYAMVYVDGNKAGEIRFPGGDGRPDLGVPSGQQTGAQHVRRGDAFEGRHDVVQRHQRGQGGKGHRAAARAMWRRLTS